MSHRSGSSSSRGGQGGSFRGSRGGGGQQQQPPPHHPSSPQPGSSGTTFQPFRESQFDIFEWFPQFLSCVRYFLDHSQHSVPVQAVASFVNIKLPCQKALNPIISSKGLGPPPAQTPPGAAAAGPSSSGGGKGPAGASPMAGVAGVGGTGGGQPPFPPVVYVTLVPYIRRLVATGFDYPAVLHGFFGDDWAAGVGPLHENERRNYLFAAKSDNWLKVKANYDMEDDQMIPFLRPLQNVTEKEITTSETSWSEWLAMQDWMLGPRLPPEVAPGGPQVKTEEL